jgi:MFS-type transporter involved in bile tolerance (Atg22 family)
VVTASIAAGQTLTVVTTVSTLTDITNIGSNGARVFQNSLMRNTYANNTRSRLSF